MTTNLRTVGLVTATTLLLFASTAQAASTPEKTLNKCQKTVSKEVLKYGAAYQEEVGKCLDQISKEIIQNQNEVPAGTVADAASKCLTAFRKLENTEKPEETISAEMSAEIAKACDPSIDPAKVLHAEEDILGTGALTEQIDAMGLDAWCTNFGGDGTIDADTGDGSGILEEWTSCLTEAATCGAQQALATKYPRLLEWLVSVRDAILELDDTCAGGLCSACGDATELDVIDACNALEAVDSAIEGATEDSLPDIVCAGTAAVNCGNGTLDSGEDCDFGTLGGNDCTTVPGGFDSGTLACGSGCVFDTSGCSAAPAPATGTITTVAASGISDGETFTLDDGTQPATTFEFDDNGSASATPVVIGSAGAGAAATGTITTVAASGISDGETFTLSDGASPAVTFEFDDDASAPANAVSIVTTATSASGMIQTVARSGLVEGETFTLDDGTGPRVFEFDLSFDGIAAGSDHEVPLSVLLVTTAEEVEAEIISAINGAAAFQIDASDGGSGVVVLTNAATGSAGNTSSSETVSNSSFFVTDMSGGDDVDNAEEVEAAIISAVNGVGAALLITASDGGTNSVTLTNDAAGSFGNVGSSENVSNAGFFVSDMSGGSDEISTAQQVEAAIISAVNGVGASLLITASDGGSGIVALTNAMNGTAGNVPITQSSTPAVSVTGMSGGVD